MGSSPAVGARRRGARAGTEDYSRGHCQAAQHRRQGRSPLMSTENAAPKLRMPRSTWFIVSTEACERFSFYGMTSILTLYLQYQMAMGEVGAKWRVHLFN